MNLTLGSYTVQFENGGVEVKKNGKLLYFNHRPIYVSVKNYGAMNDFRDCAYQTVDEKNGLIVARGTYETDNGSVLSVRDEYEIVGDALHIDREVIVEKANEDDLGFQTKIFFYEAQSDRMEDFYYFSPGQWYQHNQYASPNSIGKRMDLQYHYRKETFSGLPLIAVQHIASGETICLSRWAADATLPSMDRAATENYAYVDPKITVGSFGVSNAKPEALTYTYYGHMMTTPLPKAQCDGIAVDYMYPAVNGQTAFRGFGPYNPAAPLGWTAWVHPMKVGFAQKYGVAATFGCYEDYGKMLKATWRQAYARLRDRLFTVDNGLLYRNMMKFLKAATRQFGTSFGTPFVAELPDFDPNSFSAEIGFVGQQAGIGYQLLRWGVMEKDDEAVRKGLGILNYWTHETMTETGCPRVWMHLATHQAEPMPEWIRQIGDGLEAILDAYVFESKRGVEHPDWLAYCVSTADWLVKMQNEDGSYHRSYNYDNTCCMESKACTPCVVRFLVQMKLVTGEEKYLEAAKKAGEWTFIHQYKGFEYCGATCDNSDIMDKEAGIYAMFAFIALYDITKDAHWLEGACGAADYVETFTFSWNFPVYTPFPNHPFNRNHISGSSNVTVGSPGGDVSMAACAYSYYRLYLLTGDPQYLDFAEFIHCNVKQANDIDGSYGYRYIGLVNEGGSFSEQQYRTKMHWLPWCTFVEVDPASRFFDTFGAYDVKDIERLPMEERQKRNDIYQDYFVKK